MSEPFFSIIIPVYNVEKYVNECVDSVLAQSFTDFEVILVEDGSPDNCPAICDDYAEKDTRVHVVHKKNGGLSDARNCGVRVAQGKYLMFLDSDDYWDDPDALSKIQDDIQNNNCSADVAIFQAKLLYPDGSLIPDCGRFPENFNTMAPEEALCFMAERGLLIGSACSKVVRRVFFVQNNLFFKVGIKSEDIHWIIRVANCLPKYLYTDQYFYIYRKGRNESITANVDAAYLDQFADMLCGFAESFDYTNEQVEKCLLSLIAYEFSILMAKTANLSDRQEKKRLTAKIRKQQDILKYDMHPKVQKITLVKKLLGFDLTLFLLGIYLRYRRR